MAVELDSERRRRIIARLQSLFSEEFDEPLSDFRAEQVVDLMLGTVGAAAYNQAVQDVRKHLQGKLDDLDIEVSAEDLS